MNLLKRTVSFLLAAVLVLSVCPPLLTQAQDNGSRQLTWIPNPLYPEFPEPGTPRRGLKTARSDEAEYLELEDAAAQVRAMLVARAESVEIRVVLDANDPRLAGSSAFLVLMDAVFAHTGKPVEGDYLLLHYAGGFSGGSEHTQQGRIYYAATLYPSYLTTVSQEQEMDGAVAQVLAQLELEGLSEYQKTRKIYEYVTTAVDYDYDHMEEPDYPLQYTAYAALVQGTAVCQGYSSLLYRLLLSADVDCRCITGDAGGPHGWNIVRLGDRYYYADATWDEAVPPAYYRYFLKGKAFAEDRRPDPGYLTEEFRNAYPISDGDYDPAAHSHVYAKTETAPDCDTDGYNTFTCDCGYSTIRWTDPALGHVWDEGTVVTEPTEHTEGLMRYTCTRCAEERTKIIDKLPHTHHYTAQVTEPGCTADGYTTYTCACGDSYIADETEALGHQWDEGVEQENEILYTCTRCGETKAEEAEQEHTHSYETQVFEPGCETGGYTLHFCQCGDAYSTDSKDPLGHTRMVMIVSEPTCERMGYTQYICRICNTTLKSSYTSQLPHQRELDWRGNGIYCYVCTLCDSAIMLTEPICQEHDFQTTRVEASCTAPGYTQYTCKRCSVCYQEDIVDPLGHLYAKFLTLPVCGIQGVVNYRCFCGEGYTEYFDSPFEHSYHTEIIAPTCTGKGYTLSVCEFCGDSVGKTDWTDPIGHDYEQTRLPATCREYVSVEHLCRNCGHSYVTETGERGDHVWGEDYVYIQPTLDQEGELRRDCQNCAAYQWETLPKLSLPFEDVAPGTYYFDPVFWALRESITSGTDATHFAPNSICTRGQVVTFLWRAAGSPEPSPGANPFTDVQSGHYFYKSVLWAVQQGITQGVGGGRFAPNQEVTRGQFVTFLWRWGGKVVMPLMEGRFADVQKGAYYSDAVNWAVENAVTAGLSDVRFGPDQGCTRAQVVTFLYRYSRSEATTGNWFQPPQGVQIGRDPNWQPQKLTDLATLPEWTAEITPDNVRKILESCAPDSAVFLRWNQEDYMSWLNEDDVENLVHRLNLATHETYHGYSGYTHEDIYLSRIYLAYGYYVDVRRTDTFRTVEIAERIPEELRTFRYETYVPDPSSYSNVCGIYGLLEEFNAYSIGMRHDIAMFDYFCQQGKDQDVWLGYLSDCENDCNAYAEFLYWMLTYLMYARENYPSQYQAFMNNLPLRYAFTVIEGRFTENIAFFEAQLDRLLQNRIPGLEDYFSQYQNALIIGDLFYFRMNEDYETLMEVLAQPEYQQMLETFRLR